MREIFAELWRNGSADDRRVIVSRILAYVFQDDQIRPLFEKWAADAKLAEAYAEGVKFAEMLKANTAHVSEMPFDSSEKDPEILFQQMDEFMNKIRSERDQKKEAKG